MTRAIDGSRFLFTDNAAEAVTDQDSVVLLLLIVVVGLVVLNVLCAAIGQPYSPDA